MIDSLELTETSRRQVLAEVLASETLKHSDQLRKILQFICEAAIEGRGAQLTESVIAIDVLNRLPSYSPADDATVRSRIYALRRKLAQYYESENPSAPIRIEIPKGGYVPRFFLRAESIPPGKAFHVTSRLWFAFGIAVVSLAIAGALAFHLRNSDILGVWAPLIDSGKNPIIVIVGSGEFVPSGAPVSTPGAPDQNDYKINKVNRIGTGDARALFLLGILFGRLHASSQLRLSATTSLEDLHRSPDVLLSAFNNQFTLEATNNLRYYFVQQSGRYSGQIEDRKDPSSHWQLEVNQDGKVVEDYGIAARLMGQQSQEPMIVAAGLEQCGTEASLSLLTDALPQLIQRLPAGWEHKNFEVVVGVHAVNGSCGVPSIIRTEVW
jgi:hypothetical protein